MADDYDYGGDEMMAGYDDDWIYVEDEFALADELAETQIADPGYAGTNEEIELESYEYDLYGYWDDLEYANDDYWDYDGRQARQQSGVKVGQKRKRGAGKAADVAGKRRKVAGNASAPTVTSQGMFEPAVFKSWKERDQAARRRPVLIKDATTFALLPDWKEKFASVDGELGAQNMPADMQRAAESTEDDAQGLPLDETGDEEWEDEEGDEVGEDDAGLALDPDMLKTILRQRLSAAGLEGMDESGFMAMLSKMLAGEDGDDAAAELTNSLLGRATEGDASLSGWLSQQGVSLDAADDDASSVATLDLPERAGLISGEGSTHSVQVSPSDSAVMMPGPSSAPKSRPTRTLAHHPSSPERQIQHAAEKSAKGKRKSSKKVTFDVPPSSEPSTQANGTLDTEPEPAPDQLPPTSSDPLTSERTIPGRVAGAKAVSAPAPDRSDVEASDQAEVIGAAHAKATPVSTRQTRKRKAASADDEPKTTKRTRSSRATAKAATK